VLIRHLWQLKTVVFLHWCIIRVVPLVEEETSQSPRFVSKYKNDKTQQLDLTKQIEFPPKSFISLGNYVHSYLLTPSKQTVNKKEIKREQPAVFASFGKKIFTSVKNRIFYLTP
jgi:hypothetical protein